MAINATNSMLYCNKNKKGSNQIIIRQPIYIYNNETSSKRAPFPSKVYHFMQSSMKYDVKHYFAPWGFTGCGVRFFSSSGNLLITKT